MLHTKTILKKQKQKYKSGLRSRRIVYKIRNDYISVPQETKQTAAAKLKLPIV